MDTVQSPVASELLPSTDEHRAKVGVKMLKTVKSNWQKNTKALWELSSEMALNFTPSASAEMSHLITDLTRWFWSIS